MERFWRYSSSSPDTWAARFGSPAHSTDGKKITWFGRGEKTVILPSVAAGNVGWPGQNIGGAESTIQDSESALSPTGFYFSIEEFAIVIIPRVLPKLVEMKVQI